jgi:choline dehydrogenase
VPVPVAAFWQPAANPADATAMRPNHLATEQTDPQLQEHARNNGGTMFYQTSTCRMAIDPLAAVEPELRGYRIGGLCVADASVMPAVVSGNTSAATIMIGEKCADMVRRPAPLVAAA